jgi:Bacterial Ig-like domain (group 3)
MHTKEFSVLRALRSALGLESRRGRARTGLLPQVVALESRLPLSTFTWTAGGDGMTWNDPNNWRHFDPMQKAQVPGTPTAFSDVVFPTQAILPKGFSKTINFNFTFQYMPLDSLTILDSYTFTGTPITIEQSLSLSGAFTPSSNGPVTDIELAGMKLAPGATIYTQTGTMLQLGTTASPTGFLLGLQGAMSKTGGGQLLVDTSSVSFPTTPTLLPVPVSIAAGSITLGASVQLSAVNFDVAPNANLIIADNVVAGVRSLSGTGFVNLAGTTAAGDLTSLTIFVPKSSTDIFGGLIAGTGQFIMGGFGNLTTGSINFQGAGGIKAAAGSLQVNGTISAGSLLVNSAATFGGLGTWSISGPVVFQSGSTFLVTLNGTSPASQYTQLVDTSATSGVDLGFSTLAASINYSYVESDLFTVIQAPLVKNAFVNVISGQAVLDGVPFAVSTGQTAVKLAPLQSLTSAQLASSANPSFPGQPVTFSASVNTRTAPVSVGTVSFMQGGVVVATVPVASGAAVYTTASLPLGTTAITAVYNGTIDNVGSTSPTLAQMVVPYPTATSIASSNNPAVLGQTITLMAAVENATGPLTAGTVTFRRGNKFLGTVPLDGSGTAHLSISSLPLGTSRIQAVYNGTPGNLSSVSPILKQTVNPLTTMTVISLRSQVKPNGQTRYLLVAMTSTVTGTLVPSGTVVFRKNGRTIGSARLTNGTGILRLRGKAAPRGRFVARFQGTSRFGASNSAPIVFG